MKRMKQIHTIVHHIMAEVPETRNDDDFLYLMVCRKISNEPAIVCSVDYFLLHRKQLGFPSFETVRRTRQKIQAEHPRLSASAAVEAARMEEAKKFKGYALSKV